MFSRILIGMSGASWSEMRCWLRISQRPPVSQSALAEAVGLSRASIANIERGHHRVQIHVLYDIAVALGVEPHELLPHPRVHKSERAIPHDIGRVLSPKEQAAVQPFVRQRSGAETKRPVVKSPLG